MAPKREQDAPLPPERRNRASAVGNDARRLAERAFGRAGFTDCTVVLRWEEIVGQEVARLARPMKLNEGPAGGVLTLKAEPAASVFLQHETRALCGRINAFLGRQAVQRLRFVYGTLASEEAEPRPPPPATDAPTGDAARRFEGPEGLKAALLALARTRTNRPASD